MKANEFVKEFGLDEAKRIVNSNTVKLGLARYISDWEIADFEDLKQLIESHDLLSTYSDINTAKFFSSRQPENIKLKQAIADVDSCQ